MSITAGHILTHLKFIGNADNAQHAQRFFKTGKGEYGEGDIFVGIRMPVLRGLAKEHRSLSLPETTKLLHSPLHEARMLSLLILVAKYKSAKSETEKQAVYDLYMDNIPQINGWDLVDCSAEHIPGAHLYERSRKPLYKLAKSKLIWDRRVAIMSTFHFLKKHDFEDTFRIAEMLLHDHHDLIHKAAGWMLREVGNRDQKAEEAFLKEHYKSMPRTMLRYAIEKFPEARRKAYLKGTI